MFLVYSKREWNSSPYVELSHFSELKIRDHSYAMLSYVTAGKLDQARLGQRAYNLDYGIRYEINYKNKKFS